MKTRFSTFDLLCSLTELKRYIGLRVHQVYDIDSRTYLIKLQKPEEKVVLLLESGNRIHTTEYEWPKNPAPSGFSMKLRKHLKNKRLENIRQLGVDRIVDLQFGTGEAEHHVFLELFDRGNIMLTDRDLTILYVLRPHTQGDRYVFAVREKYPVERARGKEPLNLEQLQVALVNAKKGENLRKVLTPQLEYGPALIDHALLGVGLSGSSKLRVDVDPEKDMGKITQALEEAERLSADGSTTPSKGYIIQKSEKKPLADGGEEILMVNVEFHPFLFRQFVSQHYQEFDSFVKSVDFFFSSVESQKIDLKLVQQERAAVKKLENVKKDHNQRLEQLEKTKEVDSLKGELITNNQELVDRAIEGVRACLASQMAWPEVEALVKQAGTNGDQAAAAIKAFKLQQNQIVMHLTDPYDDSDSDDETAPKAPVFVDIDLDLSAFANARRYYDDKRSATKKQQKTLESQGKAFKSAEKKTKKSLQEMNNIVNITKARKVFWFEKFFWFISSENYLVIGGRDAVQNELLVKRYMRPTDIYVHADVHGASSIVIKNPSDEPVPPKTLNEAGTMAICYSSAWEAKVITSAWWVRSDQVLKSAPTGEYLPTGSFSIRGKKNYLPPCSLILGFTFMFKLEDGSIERHLEDRKVRLVEEVYEEEEDVEIPLSDTEDSPEAKDAEIHSDVEEAEDVKDDDVDESTLQDSEVEKNAVVEFPDTQVNLVYSGNDKRLETKPAIKGTIEDEDDVTVVYLGDDKPIVIQRQNPSNKKSSSNKSNAGAKHVKFQKNLIEAPPEEVKPKPVQKSKQKKGGKNKYVEDEEEDLRLKMEFLQAAASKKKNSKKEKKKELAQQKQANAAKNQPKPILRQQQPKEGKECDAVDSDDEQAEKERTVNADLAVIDSLTGCPHPDDELLFAVPVVTPYATLHNYKFKVKLTPGTGKRGKAARQALAIFLKDKSASQRERNLLKGVKDVELARNLPGKLKLSAPQLHKK